MESMAIWTPHDTEEETTSLAVSMTEILHIMI